MPPEKNTGVAGRPMTFGEKAVGLSFNPSQDPTVAEIKGLYAQIIDLCDKLRGEAPVGENGKPLSADRSRMYSIAITDAQTSQMWAVKAATWQEWGII